jgi:iron complex transport system substrate-binding protein
VFFGVFVSFVAASGAQEPRRIVSLVPNVTEVLFAVGAGPQVVAVSSFDDEPPQVRTLPRVGGLLDPDTERILALKPDLVIVYGSQTDLKTQLARANIPLFDYRHGGLADVLATIRTVGARTGRAAEAARVAAALEQRLAAVRARVADRRRPRTLLVFGREPGSLRNIWVSGGVGFLHDMLVAAGGENVFAGVARESVQATTETILARAPEAILELRSERVAGDADVQREIRAWAALASVPAVKNGRVIVLTGPALTVPGPRIAESIERMAAALHP